MLLKKFEENWQYIVIFILSTFFFLHQHSINKQLWDFYAYSMNAKFWFASGSYFELYRAPLAPFLIGLFGANLVAEYIFIVFVSAIFALATYKLARCLGFDEVVFYGLSMNAFVLLEGLANGTELLSLALLEIAVFLVLIDKVASGIFVALSSLARYNMIAFFPIAFFHRNWKKILISLLLFGATFLPWFIYNKIFFGNFFASIADSYALNIFFRDYIQQPPSFLHFLAVANILIIPFVLGLTKVRKERKDILMLFLLLVAIISYVRTPIKVPRYLFAATLPIVYFACKGFDWKREHAFLIFVFSLGFAFIFAQPTAPFYVEIGEKLEELNLTRCKIESNVWPFLNYVGYRVYPPVRTDVAQKELENGVIFVHHKSAEGYVELKPVIYDGGYYKIFGYLNCTKAKEDRVIYIYLKQLNYNLKLLGYNYSYDYCDVLPAPKLCRMINKI